VVEIFFELNILAADFDNGKDNEWTITDHQS
jgi:hypothetical protein